MGEAAINVGICHACKFRGGFNYGKCPCTVDFRDIIQHATADYCPNGKFGRDTPDDGWAKTPTVDQSLVETRQAPRIRISYPCGDWFAALAKVIGAERLARWIEKKTGKPCGCTERRKQMNAICAKIERWARRFGVE